MPKVIIPMPDKASNTKPCPSVFSHFSCISASIQLSRCMFAPKEPERVLDRIDVVTHCRGHEKGQKKPSSALLFPYNPLLIVLLTLLINQLLPKFERLHLGHNAALLPYPAKPLKPLLSCPHQTLA